MVTVLLSTVAPEPETVAESPESAMVVAPES